MSNNVGRCSTGCKSRQACKPIRRGPWRVRFDGVCVMLPLSSDHSTRSPAKIDLSDVLSMVTCGRRTRRQNKARWRNNGLRSSYHAAKRKSEELVGRRPDAVVGRAHAFRSAHASCETGTGHVVSIR